MHNIENISSKPLGASKRGTDTSTNKTEVNNCKKATTSVQRSVNEFVSDAQTKQRHVEEMSSADQQEKPSSQGYGGTGARRRRSRRLENRRKGLYYLLNIHRTFRNNSKYY